jgi:hypothetical protein
MMASVDENIRSIEDGRTKHMDADSFIDILGTTNEGRRAYHLQIAYMEEDLGPVGINFGKIDFPCFADIEFTQLILDRYQDHTDEFDCVHVNNLQPEDAVDIVIGVLNEYQQYLHEYQQYLQK